MNSHQWIQHPRKFRLYLPLLLLSKNLLFLLINPKMKRNYKRNRILWVTGKRPMKILSSTNLKIKRLELPRYSRKNSLLLEVENNCSLSLFQRRNNPLYSLKKRNLSLKIIIAVALKMLQSKILVNGMDLVLKMSINMM